MKYLQHLFFPLLGLLIGLIVQALPARADDGELDFTLANQTGYRIKEIYIAPSSSTDWGDNILSKPLENDDSIAVTFGAQARAEHWDIRIVWIGPGADVVWKRCTLSDISKVTLRYDRGTGETIASTE